MALRHVLLGLLSDRPGHGYELKRRLSPGMAREQLINDGALYPLLRQMEADGLIAGADEARGGRRRRVFSATPAGRREFMRWLRSAEDEGEQPSYLLYVNHPLVKLLFAAHLSRDELAAKVAAQRRRSLDWLEALEAFVRAAPEDEMPELNRVLLDMERRHHRERLRHLDRLAEVSPGP